ncbi:hypothetical protein ACI78Q_00270 [Geodermatophilus sp. SYSU D00705]
MAELGTVAGLTGLGLVIAVLLIVVVFVGLGIWSLRQDPTRQTHVLALLDRLVNLVAAVRAGAPASPAEDSAPTVEAKPADDAA